jgi:hypothetical protein
MRTGTASALLAASFALLPACVELPGIDPEPEPYSPCREGEACVVEDWQISSIADLSRAELGLGGGVCAGVLDEGSDGTLEASWTMDSSPGRTVVLYDRGDDGSADDRYVYEYDRAGRPTLWRFDQDNDDSKDYEYTWTYLPDGRVTSEGLFNFRLDRNGLVSSRKNYSYFQDHIDVSSDTGIDGVDEKRIVRLDAAGHPVREDIDRSNRDGQFDGVFDEIVVRSFDEHGATGRRAIGPDADEGLTKFQYDEAGRPSGWTVDRDGDGLPEEQMLIERDGEGRIVTRQYFAGETQRTLTYAYDCGQ